MAVTNVWKGFCCEISFRWGNPPAIFPRSVSRGPYRHSFPNACNKSCRSWEGEPEALIHKVSLTSGSLASAGSYWAYSELPTVFYDYNFQGAFFLSQPQFTTGFPRLNLLKRWDSPSEIRITAVWLFLLIVTKKIQHVVCCNMENLMQVEKKESNQTWRRQAWSYVSAVLPTWTTN